MLVSHVADCELMTLHYRSPGSCRPTLTADPTQLKISIYVGFIPGSCSPKPEVEAPTTLRGGDGGEHRDEASGPGLPLLSDALLHSGNTEYQEDPHEVVQLRQ